VSSPPGIDESLSIVLEFTGFQRSRVPVVVYEGPFN
jgi:hypothetical protein